MTVKIDFGDVSIGKQKAAVSFVIIIQVDFNFIATLSLPHIVKGLF